MKKFVKKKCSMENLKEFTKIAKDFLCKDGTQYLSDRKCIDEIFKFTKNHSKDSISLRLAVVDSFYSTNMSKRLFGIADLVEEISKIGNDQELFEEVEKYKKREVSKLTDLLKKKYGISKKGEYFGEARSLISKYLYFVTEHKFPIEDSLVKNNLNTLLKYFQREEVEIGENLLHEIIQFCDGEGINYDEFDNLLWLIGKINKGSLGFLNNKEDYLEMIRLLELQAEKSDEIDKEISEKLKDDTYISKIKEYLPIELLELNKNMNPKTK